MKGNPNMFKDCTCKKIIKLEYNKRGLYFMDRNDQVSFKVNTNFVCKGYGFDEIVGF
jgi:hypothetical protein